MAAWVKGGAVDADAAIAAAAMLLGAARTPMLAGLNAEVAAIGAAFRLAEAIGASVDFSGSEGAYAELGSLSRTGAMTTTPAEAVGRADLVLVVGANPWNSPVLAAIEAAAPTRGRAAGAARDLLSLGGPSGKEGIHAVPAEAGGLAASLAHLRAVAKGNLPGTGPYGELARRLSAAQYGVLVYDAGEIGEVGVEVLQGLVKDLNETTRAFALGLGGADQGRSVVQVSAWTSGQAPRTGFGRHLPEHDPWRFDSARLAAAGEADAALWIASLPGPRPAWLASLRSVAIVAAGSPEAVADAAEIVIPVDVPGEGTGGVLWNEGRAALTYRAGGGTGSGLTAADVLGRLAALIAAERPAGNSDKKDAAC